MQFPDQIEIQPVRRPVIGTAAVPGSKSITNRALALAALAQGTTRITGALFADDTDRMVDCLRALGFRVECDHASDEMTVHGGGGKIPATHAELFVGNSGTTARFITPLVALGKGDFHLDGVARMRERPMADLIGALTALGVNIVSRESTGCAPLQIAANGLHGGACTVRADISSQFLSGLLLAAPLADGDATRIAVDGPLLSRPYVDLTKSMIRAFGGRIDEETPASAGAPITFTVAGRQSFRSPEAYAVEPDASSASYFWAAAAITGGRVRVPGIGRNAVQGDASFVDVLEAMGCRVERGDDYTEVQGTSTLRGGTFDMNAISDTVMTLAAVAIYADGPTRIENVAHIRHKETDRLSAVAAELSRLGVSVAERPDGLTITPPPKVRPATIQTYDDHRMAMAFALVGLRSSGVHIADPACVRKTFPDYFARLRQLVEGETTTPPAPVIVLQGAGSR